MAGRRRISWRMVPLKILRFAQNDNDPFPKAHELFVCYSVAFIPD
jgi:hypothetical protein